jgi:hypothetical protein
MLAYSLYSRASNKFLLGVILARSNLYYCAIYLESYTGGLK